MVCWKICIDRKDNKMKKRTLKIKLVCMVFVLIALCLGQTYAAECGDVNANGDIDILDALIIAQYYVGLNPANFDSTVADVNGDSGINIVDALLIAQYYVGLINELPGCSQTPEPTPSCEETRPPNPPQGSLNQVNRSLWASGVPNEVNMYIYVPGAPSSKPPIVVSCHSCGNSATGQYNNNQKIVEAANRVGFIIIFPDNSQKNCWDVGSTASLTHDGGGDTHAIAQMVQYTLATYNADPDRVYIMGGSSGAMMTQAMLAVYPDIFKAGSARAGVPAGCWADGYDPNNQWCGNCAGGRTIKTAEQWGNLARGMYPGYNGPRPRVQLYHGMNDSTISYNNMGEAIKQWTNVLGLSGTPSYEDTINPPSAGYTYNREFWTGDCNFVVFEAWSSPGNGHSMSYEEDAILEFFGLEEFRCFDPEVTACSP
jgi:acetylxylan esterase